MKTKAIEHIRNVPAYKRCWTVQTIVIPALNLVWSYVWNQMFSVEERVSMAADRRRATNADGAAFMDFTKSYNHTPSTEVKKCYRSIDGC